MKNILRFIFHHKRYKEVTTTCDEIIKQYKDAFDVWSGYRSYPQNIDFESKEDVVSNVEEIKELASWIDTYDKIRVSHKDAILWLFNDRGLNQIPALGYDQYKLIHEHLNAIKENQLYIESYNRLMRDCREAVEKFLSVDQSQHSNEDKKKAALHETEIKRIESVLRKARVCKSEFRLAWNSFSKGRDISEIPLAELQLINDIDFFYKNEFLKLYSVNPELIKLIATQNLFPIDSFSKEAIEQQTEIYFSITFFTVENIEMFSADVSLGTSDEHKRAILDSELYGNMCRVPDSFSIKSFYSLREEFDLHNVEFDVSVLTIKKNEEAIKAFNKEQRGKDVIYIEDYLNIMIEGSPLFNYVANYIDELRKRELSTLRSCVSSWHIPNKCKSQVKCFSLYYYYPTNCSWEASEDEWEVRNLIWDFKASPHQPQSKEETIQSHRETMESLLPEFQRALTHFFGSSTQLLTLVCIPSSKKEVTELRYKDFSEAICKLTGMANGFCHIKVIKNGLSKNDPDNPSNHSIPPVIRIDLEFFKGRYVLLFDDVITTGASMERFKTLIQAAGGTVIGGISIGKTKHERQSFNPIDRI